MSQVSLPRGFGVFGNSSQSCILTNVNGDKFTGMCNKKKVCLNSKCPPLHSIERANTDCTLKINAGLKTICKQCDDLLNIIGKNGVKIDVIKENGIVKIFIS